MDTGLHKASWVTHWSFMMDQTILSIVRSWSETNHCMHELPDILEWIRLRNETVTVDIKKSRLEDSDNWYYSPDEGCINPVHSSR